LGGLSVAGAIGAQVLSGVNQATPFGTSISSATGAAVSVTLPANGGAIDCSTGWHPLSSPTQTQLYNQSETGNLSGASQYSLTPGSQSFGWTASYAEIAYPVNSGDVYQASYPAGAPSQVFFNNVRGTHVTSIGALTGANEWYWASNVLYVYSDSSPSNIEASTTVGPVVNNNGKSYITYQNLSIQKGNNYWSNFVEESGGTHLIINSCDISWSGKHGVDVSTSNLLIENSTVHDNAGNGIQSIHGTASIGNENIVQNCQVYNNAWNAINIIDNYCIVQNNTVYNNGTSTGPGALETVGIEFYSDSGTSWGQRNIARYNVVYGQKSNASDGEGIYSDNGSGYNDIYYNIAYDNDGPCTGTNQASNINIFNNTCHGNDQNSGGQLNNPGEIRLTGGPGTNTIVKNNIAYSTGSSISGHPLVAIYVDSHVYNASGLSIQNNELYTPNSADFYFWNATGGNSLATFNALTGVSANLNSNPLFVSTSTPDFHLQSASPAINAGTNVSLTSDYSGTTVPQGSAPDIGAYEFLVPSSPSSLSQYKSDGTTSIASGGWNNGTTAVLKFSMASSNPSDSLTPQVEVQPMGTPFTNSVTNSGNALAYSGTAVTGTVTVTGLTPNASYHWQARTSNPVGQSSWTAYGGTDRDFGIDTTPPTTTASPAHGLYNSSQSVTLTCNDGSGVGCDPAKTYYTTDNSDPTTSGTRIQYSYTPSPAVITVGASETLKFFSTDLNGNAETVKSEAYSIDTTPPTGGSFTINSGATATNSTSVTLNITCPTDTWTPVQMAFGNSASPTNWTTCAATQAHTLTSGDGSKTVYVRFEDGGGNATSDLTQNITLITTGPTLSFTNNVEAGPVQSDTIAAGWGGATVKKWDYNSDTTCSTDSSTYTKSDADSMNQTTQTNNGKYICLYAEDALGNKSTLASANPISIDVTLPVITIVNPDTTPAQSKTITASATKSATLAYAIDNPGTDICDGSLTFTGYTSLTFSSETDNGKKVCYRAEDSIGNTAYSLSNAIAGINTAGPTLSFTDDVEAGPVQSDTITASWGDATVKLWDYDADGTCSNNSSSYTKSDADSMNQTTQTNNGKYICLYAEDALGNKTTLASANLINIDVTPPSLSITSPKAGDTVSADDTITFTDSEKTSPQCSLDNSHWDDCTSTVTSFSELTGWNNIQEKDTFILYLKDTDSVGNTGTASVDNLTKADTTAPVRSDGSPIGELDSKTTQATISLQTDENATCHYDTASKKYDDMADAFSITGGNSHSQTINNLSSGNSYTYYVRCRDGSENANDTDYLISFSVGSQSSSNNDNGNSDESQKAKIDSWSASPYTAQSSCTEKLKLTIKGKHFTNDTEVEIGNTEASTVDKKSSQKITANFCLTKLLAIQTDHQRSVTVKNPDTGRDEADKKIDLDSFSPPEPAPENGDNNNTGNSTSNNTGSDNPSSNTLSAPQSSAPVSGGNSTPNVCSYSVQSGDTLWTIAKKVYGDATAYQKIIDGNKDQYPAIASKLSIGQELTFGCENNQSGNTTNNSNTDNSSQQTQTSQPQQSPPSGGFTWWKPWTWF
jgi:hypothetical protein